MVKIHSVQNVSYKHKFHIVHFLIGAIILAVVWLGLSYGVTLYAQGVSDRITGYIDRPKYLSYTALGALSFEYPSILTPKKSESEASYVQFEQQNVSSRVLQSNSSDLYISLITQEPIEGLSMTKDEYFRQAKDEYYQDNTQAGGTNTCTSCTDMVQHVGGLDLLVMQNKAGTERVQYEIHIWTETYTYQIGIVGRLNDTNQAYIDHLVQSIKVGS
jgi:hypothetical protein